ncbi:MAG: dihydrolipoyl dehydrogenase, partial [Alphaproteobacteria bacterium]|nr:dihydrolipoyl dehydrogenase [Alphaproteobacteria bacterium]
RLLSPTQIEVTPLNCANPPRPLTAKHIVIATGSEIAPLKGVAIDEDNIVSSTGALEFDEVPKHLVIVGAGIIGLELGSVWQRLGAQVSVIEYLDRIAPGLDSDIAKAFQRILAKQGINFRLGQKVVAAKSLKSSVKLEIESVHDSGTKTSLKADKVLVAIGRRAFTDDLGLEAVGITRDTQGRIDVDAHFKTNIDGIYAIGDVIKGAMLAHKAEDEGVALAEHLAGKPTHINYNTIPSVIYTAPEVAWVGASEDELKAQNIPYKVGKFPFTANGRAKVNHTTEGFVKILADATTDMILGAHIIGAGAGDMIGELVLAMEFSAAAEDVARTCHAHPTLSEALKEAALAVDSRALHI